MFSVQVGLKSLYGQHLYYPDLKVGVIQTTMQRAFGPIFKMAN
jgi:hypothetical protein